MENKRKNISYDFILNFIFGILIAVSFLGFVLLFSKYSTKGMVDDTCYSLDQGWKYLDEAGNEHPIQSGKVEAERGETVVFKQILPDKVEEGYYLSILSSRDATIYIDGEERGNFVIDSSPLKGGPVKNVYLFLKLHAEDSGKELLIEKHSEDRYNGYVSSTFVGSSLGIIFSQVKRLGNVFVLNLFFVILSFICVIVGCLYKVVFKKPLNFTQLALSLFLVGAWLAFDSDVFQFVSGITILDGIMSYLIALMVPYPILAYINRITGKRYDKQFLVLCLVTIVDLLFFSFLHFSGIRYFGANIGWIDGSISVICAVALGILLYDFFAKGNKEYSYFMFGILIFSAFGAAEMISINFFNKTVDGYFVLFGLYTLIITAIVQQVAEINRMEVEKAKALEANESKSRFLASMSHELRTPINSIIGMDELIIRECSEAKVLEYASYIKSASNNLLGLVNDILDFSKIEAGKMDIVENEYNLADVLKEISALLRERAGAKGLQPKISISTKLPRGLYGDALHVKQVLINVISNAIKYTKSGTVSFYVTAEESEVNNVCVLKMVVSDTGIGIKEENIPKLFDYYSRLDPAKNHEIEGTGLGLSIVKQLLDSMNGSISVESDYGFGSTFTILIPQKVVNSSPIGNIDSIKTVDVNAKYKESFRAEDASILVVDDNNINLLIVKKLLENTLVNVDVVESGYEALRLASNFKYDLILLDHMMPEIDGIEVMRRIKNDDKSQSKDTNMIVLTANAVSGMREMYLNEGFSDYISKPIEPSLLEECIAKWLPPEKVQKENF